MKPALRFIKYRALLQKAKFTGRLPSRPLPRMAFVIGCGRSGTSVLGRCLDLHPLVTYLFEPYHLWRVIYSSTDVGMIYGTVANPRLVMDSECYDPTMKVRFERLFAAAARPGTELLIEKTPHNAMRLGFLERLSPASRYVHVIRDGVDVARSIADIATTNRYRIASSGNSNQWWGRGESKWHALCRDCQSRGYLAREVGCLTDQIQRGALEWLVTMLEVDRWRDRLDDRILDVYHEDVINDSKDVLKSIANFLSIDPDTVWLERATGLIHRTTRSASADICLPAEMVMMFNQLQKRFGLGGRAIPMQ